MRRLLFGVGLAVAVAGCASTEAPAPPSADRAAGAAGRVPIGRFFANDQSNWHYRVSPDGSRLAWVASHRSRATIFFRTLPAGEVAVIETGSPRGVRNFVWAADRRRSLLAQETDGHQSDNLYLTST